MRVVFVNPVAGLGGSERSLLDLFASLETARLPVDKRLVLFEDGPLAGAVRRLRADIDVRVLPLPKSLLALGESAEGGKNEWDVVQLAKSSVSALPYALAFRRAVRNFRPDLVHTNGMKAHLLAALLVPELPRVVHLRDFVSERPMSRRALPLMRRHALFVTNSKAVEADALRVDRRLRTRVVYNGIDLEVFRPRPRDSAYLAKLSGLDVPPSETVVVGLVATYANWKGHRTFLEAARRVRAALPEGRARFYVVGGPVYRTQGSQITEAELRRVIADAGLGDTGLVPFQSDVERVYQGLDVMVHASERPEPFGRTIVEAMASGCAVVVARAGGALELFDEGRTGLGFRAGDPEDLARAVLELVRDAELRTRLASAARSEAETRFGRDRLAGEIFRVYEELLGEKRLR
jgi:glycosyltransferase involved in cell wall biosynthesis